MARINYDPTSFRDYTLKNGIDYETLPLNEQAAVMDDFNRQANAVRASLDASRNTGYGADGMMSPGRVNMNYVPASASNIREAMDEIRRGTFSGMRIDPNAAPTPLPTTNRTPKGNKGTKGKKPSNTVLTGEDRMNALPDGYTQRPIEPIHTGVGTVPVYEDPEYQSSISSPAPFIYANRLNGANGVTKLGGGVELVSPNASSGRPTRMGLPAPTELERPTTMAIGTEQRALPFKAEGVNDNFYPNGEQTVIRPSEATGIEYPSGERTQIRPGERTYINVKPGTSPNINTSIATEATGLAGTAEEVPTARAVPHDPTVPTSRWSRFVSAIPGLNGLAKVAKVATPIAAASNALTGNYGRAALQAASMRFLPAAIAEGVLTGTDVLDALGTHAFGQKKMNQARDAAVKYDQGFDDDVLLDINR